MAATQQKKNEAVAPEGGATTGEPITDEARAAVKELLPDDRTIYQRMTAVLAEMPAIGKGQWNEQQKFHFRGHDDVLNALNPLLAKHGIVILPDVLSREVAHRTTRNNSVMYEVNLHVRFTCYGATGDSVSGSAWGEGTDMGDKATMKAGTMAFKAFLNQAFSVSTEEGQKYDTDHSQAEETVHGQQAAAAPALPSMREVLERLAGFMQEPGPWVKAAVVGFYDDIAEFPASFGGLPAKVKNDAGPRLIQVADILSAAETEGLFPGEDGGAAVVAAWEAAFPGKTITWPDYVPPIPF